MANKLTKGERDEFQKQAELTTAPNLDPASIIFAKALRASAADVGREDIVEKCNSYIIARALCLKGRATRAKMREEIYAIGSEVGVAR